MNDPALATTTLGNYFRNSNPTGADMATELAIKAAKAIVNHVFHIETSEDAVVRIADTIDREIGLKPPAAERAFKVGDRVRATKAAIDIYPITLTGAAEGEIIKNDNKELPWLVSFPRGKLWLSAIDLELIDPPAEKPTLEDEHLKRVNLAPSAIDGMLADHESRLKELEDWCRSVEAPQYDPKRHDGDYWIKMLPDNGYRISGGSVKHIVHIDPVTGWRESPEYARRFTEVIAMIDRGECIRIDDAEKK